MRELGKMKGAAMKVGQMLALEGRDFLPDEVVEILEQLQNKASFMSFEDVTQILNEELKNNIQDLKDIGPEPLAAASIGQVHKAIYKNQVVVIKVQYPHIRDSIESDVKILGTLLKGIAVIMRREIEIDGLLKEFGEVFLQETDYLQEAVVMKEYKALAKSIPSLMIPELIEELSTEKVLTMQFLPGKTLTQWLRSEQPTEAIKLKLAKTILDLYTAEFCEWGLVQTDPNPGNFLIHPETQDLILLDFGATKKYDMEFRKNYSKLVMASFHQDENLLISMIQKMNLIDPRESDEAKKILKDLIYESMRPMTQKYFDFSDKTYANELRRLTQLLIKELKFSPPPKELIFLHRKLGGIFQMLSQLEVNIELGHYVKRFEALSVL